MAYQISFDLEENATQEFLFKVSNGLPSEPVVEEPKEDAMEVEQVRMTKGIKGKFTYGKSLGINLQDKYLATS